MVAGKGFTMARTGIGEEEDTTRDKGDMAEGVRDRGGMGGRTTGLGMLAVGVENRDKTGVILTGGSQRGVKLSIALLGVFRA